jgi:hypothetical protein
VPRTKEQKDVVPLAFDATVGVASGVAAAVAVSPFLMCVDRAVRLALLTASLCTPVDDGRYGVTNLPHPGVTTHP